MNRVLTESIGNANNMTLLGGRMRIEGGVLTLGDKDLLHDGTSYYYLPASTSRNDFFDSLRQDYVRRGETNIFDGASVSYELKYVPVLKCGDKLLSLNNEDDCFITDQFFSVPLAWEGGWVNATKLVEDGCLRAADCSLLPIKLSDKEINYLAPRLGLKLSSQLQIVMLPFHVAAIVIGKEREYHAAQIATYGATLKVDYPLFEDATFSAMTYVFSLLAVYGGCTLYVVNHIAEAKPFLERYAAWWSDHAYIKGIEDTLNGIIPILGYLVGLLVNLVQILLLFFLAVGVVPAIAIVVPALVACLLAVVTVWLRRLFLRFWKGRQFNR